MSDVATSAHLSIGEVLSLVQEEFPDVTISKIRFLESQGLIAPERTASGYRKFYEADIDRLRWILAQQRDHFLPLKVIKRMLDEGVDVTEPTQSQPSLFSTPVTDDDPDDPDELDDAEDTHDTAEDGSGDGGAGPEGVERSPAHPAVASARRSAPGPADAGVAGSAAAADRDGEDGPGERRGHSTPADVVAALQEDPRSGRSRKGRPGRGSDAADPTDAVEPADPAAPPTAAAVARTGRLEASGDVEPMTAEELCEAAGITAELLAGLEEFGLVGAAPVAGIACYDAESLAVARVAGRYAELGVEPRHLRMYKVAAEREAGFVEQMVVPLLKQRNPAARGRALERTDELLELGADLHAALLRRKLGPVLGS